MGPLLCVRRPRQVARLSPDYSRVRFTHSTTMAHATAVVVWVSRHSRVMWRLLHAKMYVGLGLEGFLVHIQAQTALNKNCEVMIPQNPTIVGF